MRERSRKYHAMFLAPALFLFSASAAHAKEVSYTLEDRDRLVRVETSLQSLEKRFEEFRVEVDRRFGAVEKRMDRLEDTMIWGFGLLFTTMIGLVGFVLWDRRTALAPAIRRTTDLESREEKLEAALREFATKSPQMADSLKKVGLLR